MSSEPAGPVIVVPKTRSDYGRDVARHMVTAALASLIFHGALLGAFLLVTPENAQSWERRSLPDDQIVVADQVRDEQKTADFEIPPADWQHPFHFDADPPPKARDNGQNPETPGGTPEARAAVKRGLEWLIRFQLPDGSWTLNDPTFPDQGQVADEAQVAATAFGLLPFLGAGKTHKATKDNEYDKPIDRALKYLLGRQNRKTGFLGNGADKASQNEDHYAHALATIALCESYGLTQDPMLRRPAQLAVNYIVVAQHPGGGWRYRIGEAGDLSVTGWMIMALKSGQMAGLDAPPITMSRAQMFLNASCDERTEGYSYTTDTKAVTPTMTAVALLARQYIQGWGPPNRRMITAIDNHLTRNPLTAVKNIYYHYYATQVMFHFGGEDWARWNTAMRSELLSTQENNKGLAQFGSWSSEGDIWGRRGGRLMQTSLSLLTLEVY